MRHIQNKEFSGERPLYSEKGLTIENVTIHAGESSLKEGRDISAINCRFEGKYPFWCCENIVIKNCLFKEGARAGIWYSKNLSMEDTIMDSPKMFREMDGIYLKNVKINAAAETMWHCKNVGIEDVSADNADYIFTHCDNLKIKNLTLNGNYSFQWTSNVEIRDSILNTKDAFWETENVSVYDSEINGEYLGWHSKNLKLVRCHITGSQPLCYAENLVIEDCTFGEDADLAFEYSTVKGNVLGKIVSIRNPRSGYIKAGSIGKIIIDKNLKAPGDCKIEELKTL